MINYIMVVKQEKSSGLSSGYKRFRENDVSNFNFIGFSVYLMGRD